MKLRGLFIVLVCVVAAVVLSHVWVVRWDMTDDKHYSLSNATKELLRKADEPIEVTLFLQGDLNAGFRRLQKATEETLEEMKVYSEGSFSIAQSEDPAAAEKLGLHPIVVHEREQDGKTAQVKVYPYALLQYKGKKAIVALLKNTRGLSGEENLNASIENLEFAFAEALQLLQQKETPRVALLEGHGELDEEHTYDLMSALSRYFQLDRGQIAEGADAHILDGYKAIIIANPQTAFSDAEKFIIDQYIMRGGAVLWAVNGVQFSKQVLQQEGFTPVLALDLGITDMLYRYGVRVNPALVQDVQCLPIPVNVSEDPSQPNLQPLPWTYAPLLLTSQGSPITRNLGQVSSTFVSPIDAVGGEDGIEKRVLLATSTATRVIGTPAEVDLSDLNPDLSLFQYQYVPVGVSMEGVFPSVFAHRMVPEGVTNAGEILKESSRTRQVVIGSGSILGNESQQGQALPMGYDRYSGMQFSNRDVVVNAVLWLTDADGLISLRGKEVALRLLNDKRAHEKRMEIQIISTISPIVILALIGGAVVIIRRRKYQRV